MRITNNSISIDMKPDELLIVALAHIYAKQSSKSPSQVLDAWEEMAAQRWQVRVARTQRDDGLQKVAEEIYALYPTKCDQPTPRRVVRSPKTDIPKIMGLVEKYGAGRVRAALQDVIAEGRYIPDLCRALKRIQTTFEDEALFGPERVPQERPDF